MIRNAGMSWIQKVEFEKLREGYAYSTNGVTFAG